MFDWIKRFLNPSNGDNDNNPRSQFLRTEEPKTPDESFWSDSPFGNEDMTSFSVLSSPLEMHKYFEKQMDDMLKIFGFQGDDSFFGFNRSSDPSMGNFIESPEMMQPGTGDLRDQYLKPGYQQPKGNIKEWADSDLDGKIASDDIDKMFENKGTLVPSAPNKHPSIFKSFGQSLMSKTVRNSDGSMETHRTVRDNQGNEQTVVTKKWGDKEYTVTTKIDKNGKKEVSENMVNLDEDELKKLLKRGNLPIEGPSDNDLSGPNWFPFDKFFK